MQRKFKTNIAVISVMMALISNNAYAAIYRNNFNTRPLWENKTEITKPFNVDTLNIIDFEQPKTNTDVIDVIPEIHNYEKVINIAKDYLGVPYVWGGTTPAGFDCSGLVQYVYAQIGVNISRTTYTQIADGIAISKDGLREGDLVFFGNKSSPHHVGIYIGNNQYIHAPQTGETVKISNLSDRSDYACARRIVE